MCGIAGLISREGSGELESEMETALRFMARRGPDNSGLWHQGKVALGHTRLSIIDLDARSNQPFILGNDLALTFNGEIYNFRVLRRQLETLGHKFTTNSDTETIALGYREWGEGLVCKLDGMFAFGLLDLRQNKLILARDTFGKKPLYVMKCSDEILFASDIRAIRQLRSERLSLNLDAMDYFLAEISTPQPATIFNEVEQVPPATYWTFDLNDWTSRAHRYWTLPQKLEPFEEEEALQRIEETLSKAILKRTIADVPIGCFLSGGVDSGLVVSMLAAHSGQRVRTFTVALEGYPIDESVLARQVVQRYDTDHTEVTVQADLQSITEVMCEYCGEPFADSSVLPSFLVCQEISRHLKVAISGDGGDELFGGYNDYLLAYRSDRFLRDVRTRPAWQARVFLDKILSRFRGGENLGSTEHYSRWRGSRRLYRQIGFDTTTRASLWKPEFARSAAQRLLQDSWDSVGSTWLCDHLMRSSMSNRLLNDYLVKVDRTSMFHSLEVRSPLLDRQLAELAFKISPELKFKGANSKYLLKRLAQRYFDEDVFLRKKSGFAIPLPQWLREDRMGFARDLILNSSAWIYRYLDFATVKDLWRRQLETGEHTFGLWGLVCLEAWAQASELGG